MKYVPKAHKGDFTNCQHEKETTVKISKIDSVLTKTLPDKLSQALTLVSNIRSDLSGNKAMQLNLDMVENLLTDCISTLNELSAFVSSHKSFIPEDFERVKDMLKASVDSNLEYIREQKKRELEPPTEMDILLADYYSRLRLNLMLNTHALSRFLEILEKMS